MRLLCLSLIVLFCLPSYSQIFSRKDSLRGNLSDIRACYDVSYYYLNISVDPDKKFIEGYTEIFFTAEYSFTMFQIDLFENMNISLIEFEGSEIDFKREFDAVYVYFDRLIHEGEQSNIIVHFNGNPREAVNPPWDGGFSWEKDKNGRHWVGVSCQGLGASSWWPNKDHQSDEPDSMLITCSVPSDLICISNGNLRLNKEKQNENNISTYSWFVSYPINNYDVSINIGDYVHFSDTYISGFDSLDLSYYVLSYNLDKAKTHFNQVKPMLECFERYFGKYPFWNDGYALIETPYLGMEHQSGIAYGNNYLPGYNGNIDFISGLNFDYIIIHETGHEWWGNSITTNDIADMWVQEGFCTYSEVLYVECRYGYKTMLEYVSNQRKNIRNDKPIIGPYNVNKEGSVDMYQKASLMLHTLRSVINNDVLWFDILLDITAKFKFKTIDGSVILEYINSRTKRDYSIFFNQYLKNTFIPEFQYKLIKQGREVTLVYRWEAIDGFDMPILIKTTNNSIWINPSSDWKELTLGVIDEDDFRVKQELFLVDVKKIK
tara:strand:+ start:684 stop:2321 length:1638 start_codon:yes stop_codon:yes gene_type:complete